MLAAGGSQNAAPVPAALNTRSAPSTALGILAGDDVELVEERQQLAPKAQNAEAEATGIPSSVVRLNMIMSLSCIIGLTIYMSQANPDSNGVPHDERQEHAWLAEIDESNEHHIACNETYNKFVRACEPTMQNADGRCELPVESASGAMVCQSGCHHQPGGSCDYTYDPAAADAGTADTAETCDLGSCTGCPAGCTGAGAGPFATGSTCSGTSLGSCLYDPFAICDRSACNGNGDCVNGDDNRLAKCSCDEGFGGLRCSTEVSMISIAGREFGACPVSDCDELPEGETSCPTCQTVLDELLDVCIEGDVEWFHDMEDDVQLPARAKAIGCILKGQAGEREEGETIFEDMGLLPEFLEAFLITGYVCYALALLCEDFFVASLDIIVDKLGLPPDVAGATFMAAGSSAPELFVSAAGVFITHSPVGVGACAGSTMFNTMCIIGGSALIAGKPVSLQWRSIIRDCGIYIVSLVALVLMLLDGRIEGWESIVMLGLYVFYIALCAVWSKIVGAVCPVPQDRITEANDVQSSAELLSHAARERNQTVRLAKRAASAKLKGAVTQVLIVNQLQAQTDLAKSTTNQLRKDGTPEADTPVAPAHRRSARAKTEAFGSLAGIQEGGGGQELLDFDKADEAAAAAGHGDGDEHGEHHEHPGLCDIPASSGENKRHFLSHLYINAIILPRQARDKHRKSTQKKRMRFSQARGLPGRSPSH